MTEGSIQWWLAFARFRFTYRPSCSDRAKESSMIVTHSPWSAIGEHPIDMLVIGGDHREARIR